jgi:hypothetical protein
MQHRPHIDGNTSRARAGGAGYRRHTSADETILVSLGALGWTLAFTHCPEVVDGLETILHGWKFRRLPFSTQRRPDAYVTKTSAGYHWRSKNMPKPALWDHKPPVSTMSVISDIHDVFFDWLLKKNPRYLCLHGAAVRIGNGLVCFPCVHKTGKSSLCVALVSSGQMLYCDDVLPIEPDNNYGMAMGIAPLLRKPLSSDLGSRFMHFVTEHAGPSDKRWIYVCLGKAESAALGDVAPINAFVLLQRERRHRAKLEPVPKSEMLREILLQNFADQVPPVETLDRLLRITENAGCYRLRYSQVLNAAKLIQNAFENGTCRSSTN